MTGKVLWWDSRDGNGVVADVSGNEFYFDASVLDPKVRRAIKSGVIVKFEFNPKVTDTKCAYRFSVPNAKERSVLERELAGQISLGLTP